MHNDIILKFDLDLSKQVTEYGKEIIKQFSAKMGNEYVQTVDEEMVEKTIH